MDPILKVENASNMKSQLLPAQHVHFEDMDLSTPTLMEKDPFDPQGQAEQLHEALKGIGKRGTRGPFHNYSHPPRIR